jgi:hypothetical protein
MIVNELKIKGFEELNMDESLYINGGANWFTSSVGIVFNGIITAITKTVDTLVGLINTVVYSALNIVTDTGVVLDGILHPASVAARYTSLY